MSRNKPDAFFVLDVADRVSNGFSANTEDRSSLYRFQISWREEMSNIWIKPYCVVVTVLAFVELKGLEERQLIIRGCDSRGMEDKQLALNPTIEKVALIASIAAGVSTFGYLLYRAWKSERMCPLR